MHAEFSRKVGIRMPAQTLDPNEEPEQSSHWILWTALGILVLGVALYVFPAQESGETRPVFGVAHPTPGSTLLATLSTNVVHGWNDKAQLTVEVSGESRAQLDGVVVCVDTPGFRAENGPCVTVRSAAKTIELVPVTSAGSYHLLLTATWMRIVPKVVSPSAKDATKLSPTVDCVARPDGCTTVTEKAVIPLGPVRIEIDRWGRFVKRSSQFIKDMALPIILLVLGVQLNRVTAKRDRRRAAAEAKQEQIRKDREREQDEDQQIVRILLPKVMDLAGKYYLPMSGNAERFVLLSKSGMDKPEELVFYLLNFFVIARALKDNAGGIFFKDLEGEKIFASGNRILRAIALTATGSEEVFSDTLDGLAALAPKRWPRLADVQGEKEEGWTRLEIWLKGLSRDKAYAVRYLFNVLRGVLSYETNAPYFNWYHGTGAAIKFELVEEIVAEPDDAVFHEEDPEDKQNLKGTFRKFKTLLASYRARKQKDEEKQAEKDRRENEAEQIVAQVKAKSI
jgi:hypothetical protein